MTQLIIICLYLSLLPILGYIASRRFRGTSSDYMLASHSIGPFLLLMSLFGTTMTAFALVGSTGVSFRQGIGIYGKLASAAGIMHSLCFFVIGIPLWKVGRRYGFRTQIQYLRARYDSRLLGTLLFPMLVGFVITYLLVGVVGAGYVINIMTQGAFGAGAEGVGIGVPPWLGSGVVCLVVLTYVFFGGMRGTAWANAMQTMIFVVLGVVTFVTIANSMGSAAGGTGFIDNLKRATESVPVSKRSMEGMKWSVFLSYLLIPLSVGMFPHVFQHWLTARSAKAFKAPIILHPLLVLLVWAPCVMIGVWASSELSGMPAKVQTNEVLAIMVKNHTLPLLGGLLSAGILAAIMSSLDSQFLCLGTIFTEDIVRGAKPDLNDATLVRYARFFVIGIVAVTYILSLVLPRSVFELGIWSFTGFTGLFPIVVAALYWRRVTAAGAIACVVMTAVVWSLLFWRSGFGKNKGYTFPEEPLSLGLFEIPVMSPIATVTFLSAVTLIIVSLITPRIRSEVVERFF